MTCDDKIEDAYAKAKLLWPDVSVSLDEFREAGARAGVQELGNWAGDFYLACAAGYGDEIAIRLIDRKYFTGLTARIRRMGVAIEAVPDVLQTVRERLFSGSAPRIRAYNGAAPLAQWIKIVAIRTAIDFHRREAAAAAPVELLTNEPTVTASADAQTQVMKAEYRREFERTLRSLLTELDRRDQTVLRLHLVEQVSIDKIAGMYNVHRVTVARWVWNAGEIVLTGLRRHFRQQFGIELQEFESLARLVRSQLSLDLDHILRTV